MVGQAGARGFPAAEPRVERAARIVTAVATVWVAVVAFRGIAAPMNAGVTGLAGSVGVAAENVWRWHVLMPVTHYSTVAPLPAAYAWQRPVGGFWMTALFVKLLGHTALACRLGPALASVAITPLLYALGRSIWGPVPGALSAATFAVLPVVAAFANADPAAAPAVAGVLACSWGYARMNQTWQLRWLAVGLIGLCVAVMSDWSAYAFAASLLVFALLRRTTPLRRYLPPVDARRYAQWWALASGLAVLAFMLQAYEVEKARVLARFLAGSLERMMGDHAVSDALLLRRGYWQQISLTPLAIGLGSLALPIVLVRVLLVRRELEICVLATLAMAVADYAWVSPDDGLRTLWPFYFAPYIALSVGVLAASVDDGARFIAGARARASVSRLIPLAILVVFALVPILVAVQGRAAGGASRRLALRVKGHDLLVDPEPERGAMLRWLSTRLDGPARVALSSGLGRHASDSFNLRAPIVGGKKAKPDYSVLDARTADVATLTKIAGAKSVQVVGPYWIEDRVAAAAPIEAYVFEVRDPGKLESFFSLPDELAFAVQKDAWYTWELRDHFGQTPNPVPDGPLLTREQRRIAHNVAIQTGNTATADKLENELLKDLDRSVATAYDQGVALLGQIYDRGIPGRLTLYFKAPGPLPGGLEYRVREVMERAPRLSFVPVDPIERHVDAGFPVDPGVWKADYIYAITAEIRPRPGRLRYYGYWHARSGGRLPMPTKGPPQKTLLVLE